MSLVDCELLVSRLQNTQQCFSCAHGRPTMVPLADMRAVARLLAGRAHASAGPVSDFAKATQPAVTAKHVWGSTAQLCSRLVGML